ncbi:MAG: hypothetical protein SV375_06150 [Thermodesulfobacteriota bacterium]|nr:hypothetical protein [Thermodesulfobacteriota bacterium]
MLDAIKKAYKPVRPGDAEKIIGVESIEVSRIISKIEVACGGI